MLRELTRLWFQAELKFSVWSYHHFGLCCCTPKIYCTFFVSVKLAHLQTQAWDAKIFLPYCQKYWWGRDTKTENFTHLNRVHSLALICLLAFSQKLSLSQLKLALQNLLGMLFFKSIQRIKQIITNHFWFQTSCLYTSRFSYLNDTNNQGRDPACENLSGSLSLSRRCHFVGAVHLFLSCISCSSASQASSHENLSLLFFSVLPYLRFQGCLFLALLLCCNLSIDSLKKSAIGQLGGIVWLCVLARLCFTSPFLWGNW